MDYFQDEVREAIKIVDKSGNISFLASDQKSLINKMVDYSSNTIDIFVIGDVDEKNICSLRDLINREAHQSC